MVQYTRLIAGNDGSLTNTRYSLAKCSLRVLDDWMRDSISIPDAQITLESLDDRQNRRCKGTIPNDTHALQQKVPSISGRRFIYIFIDSVSKTCLELFDTSPWH